MVWRIGLLQSKSPSVPWLAGFFGIYIIEQHLNICNSCQAIVHQLSQMRSVFSNLSTHKCSDNFNINLKRKINRAAHTSVASGLNIRTISYGFSFAILLIITVIVFNNFISGDTQGLQQLPGAEGKISTQMAPHY